MSERISKLKSSLGGGWLTERTQTLHWRWRMRSQSTEAEVGAAGELPELAPAPSKAASMGSPLSLSLEPIDVEGGGGVVVDVVIYQGDA